MASRDASGSRGDQPRTERSRAESPVEGRDRSDRDSDDRDSDDRLRDDRDRHDRDRIHRDRVDEDDDSDDLDISLSGVGNGEHADLDDDDDDVDLKAHHRGIPTWDEAIGMIVATNMESRARIPAARQARAVGAAMVVGAETIVKRSECSVTTKS